MKSITTFFVILCFNSLCYGNVIKTYDGELEYSDYNETTQSDHRVRSIEQLLTSENPDGLDHESSEEIFKTTESSTELNHDLNERMGSTESVYTSSDPVTSMVMSSTPEPRQSEITTTEEEKIDSRENTSMRSYGESTTPLNVEATNQNVFNEEVASHENTSQEITSQENTSQVEEKSQEDKSQEKTSQQSTTEPTTTEPSISQDSNTSQDNSTETGDGFKRKNDSNVYYKKVEVNNFFSFKSNSENQVEAIKDPSANNTKFGAKSGSFSFVSNFILLVNLFVFSKFLF